VHTYRGSSCRPTSCNEPSWATRKRRTPPVDDSSSYCVEPAHRYSLSSQCRKLIMLLRYVACQCTLITASDYIPKNCRKLAQHTKNDERDSFVVCRHRTQWWNLVAWKHSRFTRVSCVYVNRVELNNMPLNLPHNAMTESAMRNPTVTIRKTDSMRINMSSWTIDKIALLCLYCQHSVQDRLNICHLSTLTTSSLSIINSKTCMND